MYRSSLNLYHDWLFRTEEYVSSFEAAAKCTKASDDERYQFI